MSEFFLVLLIGAYLFFLSKVSLYGELILLIAAGGILGGLPYVETRKP
jgi:hypothetical protein